MAQSVSIARFLARRYNLVGENEFHAARADMIVDSCMDMMNGKFVCIKSSLIPTHIICSEVNNDV